MILLAVPSILTPVSDCDPDDLFNATAEVPIYTLEFPKTLDGIVPVKLPAVNPDKLAPEPEKVVAVNVPVLGLNDNLLLEVFATV